jgi:hypothetical protein
MTVQELAAQVREYQSAHAPTMVGLGIKQRIEDTARALGVEFTDVVRAEQALLAEGVAESSKTLRAASRDAALTHTAALSSVPPGRRATRTICACLRRSRRDRPSRGQSTAANRPEP